MKHGLVLMVVLLAGTVSGCATTGGDGGDPRTSCRDIDIPEVEQLFKDWNAALRVGPDAVVARYASDAVLLPTVWNGPFTTSREIRKYFVHFLEDKPQGEIDSRYVQIGCNMVQDAGIYTFTLHGGPDTVQARYTFIYRWNGSEWKISHHHSSKMPQPTPEP
jgi:uncharacterized protein (TIGR02246 family)